MSTNNAEIKKFDAEVGKVLNLMIHSLYTNKDIFLRELISNASDACGKRKFLGLTDQAHALKNDEYSINVKLDEQQKTITIRDNGIGMSKQDLIDNLGTIASSGTQKFVEKISGDKKQDANLIGQFGVGFYSAFMVAEHVVVKTRKSGTEQVHIWESAGQGEYSLLDVKEDFAVGTEITLKIKEEEKDYLNKFTVEHIINTYSNHISFPIELEVEGKAEKVNSGKALWTMDKKDVEEKQYTDFYRGVAHMGDEPWLTMHNKNEGVVNFTNLLFIPGMKPFDLFNPDRKATVKLYVKRVFISEDGLQLVPAYLRFVKGIIDSDDLPLNISRETLQNNQVLEKIKRLTVKKVLSELKNSLKKDRENYQKFWDNFGAVLKEGLCEAYESREPILDIALFKSAKSEKYITLQEYIDNMQEEQKEIFYLCGDTYDKLKSSAQLEGFLSRDIDVLLLADQVDDFWVNVAGVYKEKEFKSITRSDINLEEFKNQNTNEESEKVTDNSKLLDYLKTTLKEKVKDVVVSTKLHDSPACLAIAEGSMDIRMEKFLLEQKQLNSKSQKILEVNANHKIVKHIADLVARENTDETSTDLALMLYEQACVAEGLELEDIAGFRKRLNSIIEKSL